MAFVGVDACRNGWVAVALEEGAPPQGVFISRLEELEETIPDAEGFAVDIPIGLPREGRRRADTEVRRRLGPRRNSVFFTPVRAALTAASHAEATEVSRGSAPVWEVHPELSFSVLMGHPATAPKKTWAGARERLVALEGAGIELGDLGRAGGLAAVDDVLDAAVAAWSGRRLAGGRGLCLPDPPDRDPETGRDVAIWA